MKHFPLHPTVAKKALHLKAMIQHENKADIDISGSQSESEAIFVLRSEFEYQLNAIRLGFFEGDGLIISFKNENEIRPVYVMISHINLQEKPDK